MIFGDPYFQRALLAAIGIVIVTGPLGCFLVWKRMAYFGDSLSHGALLGVTLGAMMGVGINVGVVLTCFSLSVFLLFLQHKAKLSTDTLLGIFAHGALALGIVALSFVDFVQANIMDYLIGDILSVSYHDLIWIYVSVFCIMVTLFWQWSKIVLFVLHEDLAIAEGIKTLYLQIYMMAVLAIIVSIAIQIVGVLLMTALMIIPAAAARQISKTPNIMAILASIIGFVAVFFGLIISFSYDIPTGPMIVVVAMILFAILSLIGIRRR